MSLWTHIRDTVTDAAKNIVTTGGAGTSGMPQGAGGDVIEVPQSSSGSDGSSEGTTGEGIVQVPGGSDGEIAEAPAKVDMPAPTFMSYDPITQAPYKMVNIAKFAKRWGNINRQEILKNSQLAKDLALEQLDTELKGLQNYVPAMGALKRQETAADNVFNQQQREAMVAQALPGVKEQLAAQSARAESFASGRMPSSIEDRALELGIRSRAADIATAAGFGATSSVSRKASDLLSAEERIKLSQYGDQLLTQNINQKAGLFLAPTEYSNAGQQVNVMPSVSAGQLSASNLAQINAMTGIPAQAALSTRVNQNQFVTNLTQRTNEFNASNQLATDQFNASAANQFALTEFQYEVGYEGTLAGVATTNNEIALQLQQQQQYYSMMQQYMGQMQQANQMQQWIQSIVGIGTAIAGFL